MGGEADIERKLVEEVKKRGGIAYKFVSPGNTGVPDRLVVMPDGRVWFVELKAEGGRLRPTQRRQIARLEDLKANVFILVGIPGLKTFLDLLEEGD